VSLEEETLTKKDSNGNSSSMEEPGKANNKVVLFGLIGFVVILLFFIFKPDGALIDDVDNLIEEDVETIDDSRSRRPDLEIPEKEPELSLKEKLEERKRDRGDDEVKVERVTEKRDHRNDDGRSDRKRKMDALLASEREAKSKIAKERELYAEKMNNRMKSGMSENRGDYSSTDGRGIASSSRVSSQKNKLLERRNDAKNLQKKLLSGELGGMKSRLSGLRGSSNAANETDGKLISLPTSVLKTVEAVNLQNKDFLITEGTIIQASLESAVNSNLPGKIRAIINAPVYSYSGNAKLVEETSELIGEYRTASDGGEPRLFVIWTRLITSDGISVQLDSGGIDSLGRSGASGWVDTHFMKRFGASVMLSMIGGITQSEVSGDQSQAISDSFNRSAEIALESSINIAPTVKINQGQRVAVFVNQDISFASALASRKVNRLSVKEEKQHPISYDRVFDETPLSIEERALLGNRFIKDGRSVSMESHIQKPYVAEIGDSLRGVISKWSRRGNYSSHWLVKDLEGNELDWKLVSDVTMHGTLHHVIGRLISAYKKAGVELTHQFFKENRVLVIRMKEGSDL
jgi:type IV secretory pathway VirB10-like protein